MDPLRSPFVAAALRDATEGHTQTVTAGHLYAATDHRDEFVISETFLAMWDSLTLSDHLRASVVTLMSGITRNPKHPAFRVSTTTDPRINQAALGDTLTLMFTAETPPTWLALVRT